MDGLNARMAQENANVCVRSCGPAKPHIFSATGDNARLMAQAYDELVRLQRGEMVSVLPRDRSKLFPPQRLAKEEATRVAGLLRPSTAASSRPSTAPRPSMWRGATSRAPP